MIHSSPIAPNNIHEICPRCGLKLSLKQAIEIIICPSCHSSFRSKNHQKRENVAGCNNIYKNNCPALMSDGRFATYYNSANELTEALMKSNGFLDSNKFRSYLQDNAINFINNERKLLHENNSCYPNITCSESWYDLVTR